MAGKRTRKEVQFKPGNSGGPGRPKGARNKLSEAFIADLAADFEIHGVRAIEKVRKESPKDYLRVVAALVRNVDILHFKAPKMETAKDAAAVVASIWEMVGKGEMSVEAGKSLTDMIEVYRRTLETSDQEDRIRELERNRDE